MSRALSRIKRWWTHAAAYERGYVAGWDASVKNHRCVPEGWVLVADSGACREMTEAERNLWGDTAQEYKSEWDEWQSIAGELAEALGYEAKVNGITSVGLDALARYRSRTQESRP